MITRKPLVPSLIITVLPDPPEPPLPGSFYVQRQLRDPLRPFEITLGSCSHTYTPRIA